MVVLIMCEESDESEIVDDLLDEEKPDLKQRAFRFHHSLAFVGIQNVQLL